MMKLSTASTDATIGGWYTLRGPFSLFLSTMIAVEGVALLCCCKGAEFDYVFQYATQRACVDYTVKCAERATDAVDDTANPTVVYASTGQYAPQGGLSSLLNGSSNQPGFAQSKGGRPTQNEREQGVIRELSQMESLPGESKMPMPAPRGRMQPSPKALSPIRRFPSIPPL
jgi:hypothetical protein